MAEYRNETEREETQKYEGVYTPEEIELNKKLYEECSKEVIDFEIVEQLLKQGADPLGPTQVERFGELEHVYGEIVFDSQDNDSIHLPQITELFLKYGMDIENPRVSYDCGNSINPLWQFGFVKNVNAICAMKMLLDKGISAESFAEFKETSFDDLIYCDCGDPVNDGDWNYTCVWTMKMIMLGASYNNILDSNESLKRCIGYSYNNYDIHLFREWNNYYYDFDTSRCGKYPGFDKSVVRIYDAQTHKEVWKIGIGLKEGEF
jgi:hypothetical protein